MTRLGRVVLRLYPRRFRQTFGPEILALLDQDYRRARAQGRIRGWYCGWRGLGDLALGAVRERARPSLTDDRTGSAGAAKSMSNVEGMMTGWGRDLMQASRSLRRAPGFSLVVVATLGAAIGAGSAIYDVVRVVLLDPLPYGDEERLVIISASAPGSDLTPLSGVGPEFFLGYQKEAQQLESVAVFTSFTQTVRAGDQVERVRVSFATPSLFETLSSRPVLGRLPTSEDGDRVFVMSHGMWTTWFGRDPTVIGQTFYVAGQPRTAVGVMGPGFRFPNDGVLVWVPAEISEAGIRPGRFGLSMVGRMAPDATYESLAAELDRIARGFPAEYGGSPAYARIMEQHRSVVRGVREVITGSVSTPLWVLMGAAGLLFLIACSNAANLFITRSERHRHDHAVRRALGAGRGRILRWQGTEALLLAAAGGLLAIPIAWLGAPALIRAAPQEIPRADRVGVEPATLLFILGACIVAAVACSTVPALRTSRAGSNLTRSGGSPDARSWGRRGLVTAQTALVLVLLVGSGLLLRSYRALRAVDPGYDVENVFSFQIAPEESHLTDGPSFAQFQVEMMGRLASLPGVESVGLVENLPLDEGPGRDLFVQEGAPVVQDEGIPLAFTFAGGDYFSTMGISLLAGRVFGSGNHGDEVGHVILSQSAADALWPGENPLGKRLQDTSGRNTGLETVIGVVEDVHQFTFRERSEPLLYRPMVGPEPLSWVLASPAYVVRSRRAAELAPEIRDLVTEMAPSAPMYRAFTMVDRADDSMAGLSFTLYALAVAAALSLGLGALGLYGVLAYVVARRTREIGVRMTLGAEAGAVQRMVVRQGAAMVGVGILLGLVLSVALSRVLAGLLFQVQPLDPFTFAGTAALLLTIGLTASYVPARRASSIDPSIAVRSD